MAEKNAAEYTVPGLSLSTGRRTAEILQGRLHALNDLQLTLKHAHWNVVGPGFIGVHEMLDPQIELVRGMVDVLAERIATLGVSPAGTQAHSWPPARGTTTRWAARRPWSTWPRWTSSTTAS